MGDSSLQMHVFIDECLPSTSLRVIFEERGHTVEVVGQGFPAGTPDRSILAAADKIGAVVISSDTDWQSLIRSIGDSERRGQFRRAGRILLNCPHNVAIERVRDLIETIEFEYGIAQRRGHQLIMRITGGNFRVER